MFMKRNTENGADKEKEYKSTDPEINMWTANLNMWEAVWYWKKRTQVPVKLCGFGLSSALVSSMTSS